MALHSLPVDVLGLFGLDAPSKTALACCCTAMRDAVAELGCCKGIVIREDNLHLLARSRYANLTKLRILKLNWYNQYSAPSPPPVPRPMPRLGRLEMVNCRPFERDFWDTAFERAPSLHTVVIEPVYYVRTYRAVLEGCVGLLRVGGERLRHLEIRGHHTMMWSGAGLDPDSPMGQAFALINDISGVTFRMPRLRRLVLTGGQFTPNIDAPNLESAVIEESGDPAVCVLGRIQPRGTVVSLEWKQPHSKLVPFPPGFDSLRHLRLELSNIAGPNTFRVVLESLQHVPNTLTSLAVDLKMPFVYEAIPMLKYDAHGILPLKHLTSLTCFSLTVDFLMPPCASFVADLLGIPDVAPLQAVELLAVWDPLAADKRTLRELEDDPEEDEHIEAIGELEDAIVTFERACTVPATHVLDVVTRFPRMHLTHDFPVSPAVSHPRVTTRTPCLHTPTPSLNRSW